MLNINKQTHTTNSPIIMNINKYYRGNIIPQRAAKFITQMLQTSFTSSFADEYQDKRITKEHPSYLRLSTLLTKAIANSEEAFTQYTIDDRRIKQVAKSIFVDNNVIYSDPKIAEFDGELFIIGGRHRLYAIAAVFAQIAYLNSTDEMVRGEEFTDLCEQEIRVELLKVRNKATVLELLVADNNTRTIRASEETHLTAQLLGADASSLDAPAKAALISSGMRPAQQRDIAAQNFARRPYERLTSQTRWQVGRYIAQYILFGTVDKMGSRPTVLIENIAQFSEAMNNAWDVLVEIVESETKITNFARNARTLALRVIEQLPVPGNSIPETPTTTTSDNTTKPDAFVAADIMPTPIELPAVSTSTTTTKKKGKAPLSKGTKPLTQTSPF